MGIALSKVNPYASEPTEKTNPLCDSFNYLPTSDQNMTALRSISLSYTTATGSEEARGFTIRHEIGHSVTAALKAAGSKDYLKVQSCLADGHTDAIPDKMKKAYEEARNIDPNLEKPYVEEDAADLVTEGVKNLTGKNPWCQYLGVDGDKQYYTESSMQAEDGDRHSSSLFRLLNLEYLRKENLPDSCSAFLENTHYTKHFQTCLDLANPKKTKGSSRTTVK